MLCRGLALTRLVIDGFEMRSSLIPVKTSQASTGKHLEWIACHGSLVTLGHELAVP